MNKLNFSCQKGLLTTICHLDLIVQIIFGHQNLTKYQIKYHYLEPKYSSIQTTRTIRSNSEERVVDRKLNVLSHSLLMRGHYNQ